MCKQITCAFLSPDDNFLEQLYAICVRCARDDAILEESVTKKESFSLYLNITRSYPVDDRMEKWWHGFTLVLTIVRSAANCAHFRHNPINFNLPSFPIEVLSFS
jgi:hypothetical protein